MGTTVTTTPAVGMGATIVLPNDLSPAVITKVTAKTFTLRRVEAVNQRKTGEVNGYPILAGEGDLTLPIGGEEIARLRSDGTWLLPGGIVVTPGKADYRCDYSA